MRRIILIIILMMIVGLTSLLVSAEITSAEYVEPTHDPGMHDYFDAKKYYDEGDYNTAITKFREFVDNYTIDGHVVSGYVDDAQFMIGRSYQMLGDFNQAIIEYKKVITGPHDSFPAGLVVDDTQFHIGVCYARLGQPGEAKEAHQKVIDNYAGEAAYPYPPTELVSDAQTRVLPFNIHRVYPSITPPSKTPPTLIDSKAFLKTVPKPADSQIIPPSVSGEVYVLVNSAIYSGIEGSLARYADDVEKTGLSVVIYSGTWGTPTDIRSLLQAGQPDLVGALLIGDMPVAWYEIDNDFGTYGYTNFPIDLFYMDLNGTWTDSDNNGIYDNHTGHVAPEIWVGRLYASSLTGDETLLLQNYFDKNHRYRTLSLSLPNRALVYVDDDWNYSADGWNSDVGLLYENRTLVKDLATTAAEDYKNRLTQSYEHIFLAAHSSPDLHQFTTGYFLGIPLYDYVYSSDIRNIDPHTLFYNLFACSNARYIENDYMAGWYIFADTYGLAAVGSTKTGSMLGFQYFYDPLSQDKNFGEAFKEWFAIQGITHQSWHYGMVLLGDPTLTPKIKDVSISSSDITYHPFAGKPITINATIHNTGDTQLNNIVVRFYNEDPTVGGSQIGSDESIDLINVGESKTVSMTWNTSVGSYNIYVVVDPYNSIIEIDKTNNKAYQMITVQEPTNTILLVDDDYYYGLYSYESYYKNALDAGNYSYNIWHVSALGSSPNTTILSSYQVVIWFTGNDWSTTLISADQTNLQSYLDSGGNLFISGQDIGWDLTNNGTVANTFYSNYLHAQYVRDNTNIYDLYGITEDPIGDALILNITGGDGANNQYWPSEIAPNDTYASMVFNYTGNGCGAIKVNTGTYKVVYFAFGFEAINNATDRNTVMSRVVTWLDTISPNVTSIVPANNTYVGGVQHINTTVTDNVGVSSVTANVSNSSWSRVYILTQDGNVWYNASWDTTQLADERYNITINATDGAGNYNDMEYVTVIIDNTPPNQSVIISPIEGSLVRGMININASADDALSGIAKVHFFVNGTLLGNDTSPPYSFSWNTTNASDGAYVLNVTTYDNVENTNTSVSVNVTLDNTPPVVIANPTGYPSEQTVAKDGDVVTLNATITDNLAGVKNATVNASQINSTLTHVILQNQTGYWINNSVTVNTTDGMYYLNVTAYDNATNVNGTTQLIVVVDNTPPIVTSVDATPSIIEANGTDGTLLNVTATDISGIASVIVNLSAIGGSATQAMTNNSGMWRFTTNTTVVGNFDLSVNVTDNVGNSNTSETISLTAQDTTPPSNITGLTETHTTSSVTLSYTNSSDTDHVEIWRNNAFIVNITTTSYTDSGLSSSTTYNYELRPVDAYDNVGNWTNISATTSAEIVSGGGGAPSGGGGGGAPSAPVTVTVGITKEVGTIQAGKSKVVSFEPSESDATGVVEIEISVVNTVSGVKVNVQKLKGKPTVITEKSSGMVYSYLDMSIENAKDEDIENAEITFRVDKSWITDNDIDTSTIRLNRYHDGKWNPLPTQVTGEDDTYVHLTAQTLGFSIFAITGEKKAEVQPTVTVTATPAPVVGVTTPTPTLTPTPTPVTGFRLPSIRGATRLLPGFEAIFAIIGLLAVAYLIRRNQ